MCMELSLEVCPQKWTNFTWHLPMRRCLICRWDKYGLRERITTWLWKGYLDKTHWTTCQNWGNTTKAWKNEYILYVHLLMFKMILYSLIKRNSIKSINKKSLVRVLEQSRFLLLIIWSFNDYFYRMVICILLASLLYITTATTAGLNSDGQLASIGLSTAKKLQSLPANYTFDKTSEM